MASPFEQPLLQLAQLLFGFVCLSESSCPCLTCVDREPLKAEQSLALREISLEAIKIVAEKVNIVHKADDVVGA